MDALSLQEYIRRIPKAELHLHIEGTFEPELMLQIAKRNHIPVNYQSVEEVHEAYNFKNLADFLNIYYQNMNVLQHEQDFYDLTWAYLQKVKPQNVRHVEIFFDPNAHTARGVAFENVVNGIHRALATGQEQLNITSQLIMCFIRDFSEESAIQTFKQAWDFKDKIRGVGLDSNEVGHPPAKFKKVYDLARDAGFLPVAHAGETGSPGYIWEALDILKVLRVDHGIKSILDPKLVARLVKDQIPLTVCPLSNVRLYTVENLKSHPLKKMLDLGLKVTINSDDPAYFGGYIEENIIQTQKALDLTKDDIYQLQKNAFEASFIPETLKKQYLEALAQFKVA